MVVGDGIHSEEEEDDKEAVAVLDGIVVDLDKTDVGTVEAVEMEEVVG